MIKEESQIQIPQKIKSTKENPKERNLDDVNVYFEVLSQFVNAKEVVLLYTNPENTESFSAGYVKALNDFEVLFAHLTPHGKYDGFIVKRLRDIYRIEYGGRYSNKMNYLYSLNEVAHDDISIQYSSFFWDLLLYAYKHEKVVSIELLESSSDDVVGYVESLSEEIVKIKLLDSYGTSTGMTFINIDDITHLTCDSEDESMLNTLAQKTDIIEQ